MALQFPSVLIDTNAYSQIWRKHPEILKVLASSEQLLMSVVVLGELRAGFEHGLRSELNHKVLNDYLSNPSINIALIQPSTTLIYGKLYAAQRKLGKPIPSNDLWIAAQAIELDMPLLTLDAHFAGIKGLKLALDSQH
jgi:tRNA(fMet)-specific endonuclease VapC